MERTRRNQDRAKTKESRDFKKKVQINDLSYQHKLTQPVFNRMRVREELLWFRDRGIEPYCISCQRTKMDWSCGHLKTTSAQSAVRYDPMNTFLQCLWRCNKNLSGNINGDKTSIGYKAGLLLRFGDVEGQRIIDYCDTHTETVEWNGTCLVEFRAKCAARVRDLEKQLNC